MGRRHAGHQLKQALDVPVPRIIDIASLEELWGEKAAEVPILSSPSRWACHVKGDPCLYEWPQAPQGEEAHTDHVQEHINTVVTHAARRQRREAQAHIDAAVDRAVTRLDYDADSERWQEQEELSERAGAALRAAAERQHAALGEAASETRASPTAIIASWAAPEVSAGAVAARVEAQIQAAVQAARGRREAEAEEERRTGERIRSAAEGAWRRREGEAAAPGPWGATPASGSFWSGSCGASPEEAMSALIGQQRPGASASPLELPLASLPLAPVPLAAQQPLALPPQPPLAPQRPLATSQFEVVGYQQPLTPDMQPTLHQLVPQQLVPQQLAPQPLAPQQLAPQQLASQQMVCGPCSRVSALGMPPPGPLSAIAIAAPAGVGPASVAMAPLGPLNQAPLGSAPLLGTCDFSSVNGGAWSLGGPIISTKVGGFGQCGPFPSDYGGC